MEIEDNLI